MARQLYFHFTFPHTRSVAMKYSSKNDAAKHTSPHAGMGRDSGGSFRSSASIAGDSPNGDFAVKKFGPKNCSWKMPDVVGKSDLDEFTEPYGKRDSDGDGDDWK